MIVNQFDALPVDHAAEVAFLKAEYELRWGTKDAAKALYEQAIRLSFEDKGAKDARLPISPTRPENLRPITIRWAITARPP